MRKHILFILLLFSGSIILNGQDQWSDIVTRNQPDDIRMSSMLWQLGVYARTDPAAAWQKAISKWMLTRSDSKILVEVVRMSQDEQVDASALQAIGIEVESSWKRRAECWVSLAECIAMARQLPDDHLMHHVIPPREDDQGPGLMNSQDYIDNGANGVGIRVAVIDRGYLQLSAAQSAGAAPASLTTYSWTTGGMGGSSAHGTGCLETVFDNAPGATYFIHRISTATDFGQAINQAIDDNVDIITHSLPWYNTGWNDNSGDICSDVQDATNAGILFFTSAGNRNGTHWQGVLSDSDGDDWHQWSGADEQNNFTVNPGGEVSLYLQWYDDPDPIHDDYDLYLYRDSDNTVLESSTADWSYEEIHWENTSASSVDVYVAVLQHGDHVNTFEIFNHDAGCTNFQYASTNGSTTSPSNSTQPNCLSIGAVPRTSYTSIPGTSGIIASYSSRGPTNSGAMTPDAVAPTNTTTVAYGGDFGGTSCATPNAAGMAAAFWSEHNYLSASGVRMLILRQAELYNNWGTSGSIDYIYGMGGFEIYDWINNSRFIYYGGGNTTGTSALPYYTIEQADLLAPTDFTMIFLGEIIPAPPAGSTVIDKQMLYVSPLKTTIVN